ncbi:sensor histidine kinase [Paenibacillus ferrarius]|uniref:sensor histidine kinase n=1 Tax=Paenibacillus ferrarius TaxID=1469647 RepID=UPI003D2B81BC
MNLFQKLLLPLMAAILIPVALLGYLSYERSKMQIEDVTSAFLQDNLQHNTAKINEFLAELDTDAFRVIASSKLQTMLQGPPPQDFFQETEFINVMKGITEELKGPFELMILPNHEEKYPNYMNSFAAFGLDLNAELISKAYELGGKPYWLVKAENNHIATNVYYVRGIRTLTDFQNAGVMVFKISNAWIGKQLITPSQYPRFRLLLTDRNANILTYNPAEKPGNNLPAPASLGQGKRNFETETIQGKPYYVASQAIADSGKELWNLVATIPVSDLTDRLNAIKAFTFWLFVISLLVMFILLFVIVRQFTSPIQQVVRHMRQVQLGRLVYFMKFGTRKDEIGQMVRGFNAMIHGMETLLDTTRASETEKQQLQQRMLINQINPHFLYNTLDAIKWKAEFAQEASIAEMVTTLADMLRFSINDGEEWTTMERELEHVRNYVTIELLRNNHAFQVLFHVQPSLLQMKILKLLIQPLMENAVRHGMNKLTERKGKIILTIYQEDQDMIILVEDNGNGCEPERLMPYKSVSSAPGAEGGIGLYNVHRRLQLHYGHAYGVEVENVAPYGFKASLRYPIQTAGEGQ